ncbi:MFS family permease [Cryobacterium mesophilum]|uniref:MFS transporter n=1 Tax=Terrimesophilobacter mesophilus TaxID=433647 RepID=A0A4R8V945_9MICO|nr:MFS transporter [Terrimesophilobacter mesophilus]MBB5632431.1 MFS family permease [Terrimesophilobacter mesophilus]TFB79263.1 MFS transporter [Terrimesophilobacter mesophilus]
MPHVSAESSAPGAERERHPSARAGRGEPGLFSRGYLWITIGSCALVFLGAFESLAVTTIMPVVSADLDGVSLYALAFAGPLATGVIGMVIAGNWSDRSGPVIPLYTSSVLFATGLLIAGTAFTMPVLVLGRLVQGLGTGAVTVALYVVVARVFPPRLHPSIFAGFAAAWVIPSLVGPVAAGVVTEIFSWHWVFLGVVALVGIATAMVAPALRGLSGGIAVSDAAAFADSTPAVTVPTSPAALAASPTGSEATVPAAMIPGPPESAAPAPTSPTPWAFGRIAWAVVAAAAVLALSLVAEVDGVGLPLAGIAAIVAIIAVRPLLPRGTLLSRRGLPSVILLRGLAASAFFGAEVYLPYLLIENYDFSPTLAGLALTFGALAWAGASWLQGRLSEWLGNAACTAIGSALVLAAIVSALITTLFGFPPVLAIAGWILGGGGMGLMYPRLSTLTLALSIPGTQGFNSSALAIGDSLGSALSLALTGVVFAGLAAIGLSFAGVFAFAGLIAVVAIVVAPRVAHTAR